MEFDELMQSFAAKLGMESIAVENDMVALEIDGMAFGFFHSPASDTLTLVVDLGRQSVDADGAFGSMMLKANFLFEATKGATLFLNPENDAFGMQQMFRLSDLDADELSAEVEKLSNLAEEWRRVLAGCADAETALRERKAEESEAAHLAFDGNGLMQV